jgi:hypothetical protein
MTVHINDMVKTIGRKPISGDVFELPHLRDDFALNEFDLTLPRYYVIEDVGRASEGFSNTWYPHLYRLKCKKVTDNQQFAQIFNQAAKDANGDDVAGTTLKDLLSTFNKEIAINDQIVAQAEADAPKSGYETRQFYTLAVDTQGNPTLETADETTLDASNISNIRAGAVGGIPNRTGYTGYLVGDGIPVNGYDFGFGIQFPASAQQDDFFLRTDFLPNRLFRFDSTRWIKVEDGVRMTMSNTDTRSTLKAGFINNTAYTYNDQAATGFSHNLTPITGQPAGYILKGTSVIYTLIDYITAAYVTIKLDSFQLDYAIANNPTMLGSYSYTNNIGVVSTKLKITLPTGVTTPYDGLWSVTLYNYREAQRASLSTALKPKADF